MIQAAMVQLTKNQICLLIDYSLLTILDVVKIIVMVQEKVMVVGSHKELMEKEIAATLFIRVILQEGKYREIGLFLFKIFFPFIKTPHSTERYFGVSCFQSSDLSVSFQYPFLSEPTRSIISFFFRLAIFLDMVFLLTESCSASPS